MSKRLSSLSEQNGDLASESEHLRTDHLLPNIGQLAVSGGFVTVAAQAAKFALNFGGAAILARLLSPKEFGLVGMVLGVAGVVGIFNELGLSTATVQRQKITQEQVSNLFWINVAVSGIVTVASCGLAPILARFYHDPRVSGIMVALSLMFVLTGSTVQHRALLARQMRFRALAVIDVASMLVGFTTAGALAWLGFAYWALVAQQLVYSLALLVLTWIVSRWRPNLPSLNSGVRPLLSFGAHLTIADFVVRSVLNADSILIGKLFGAAPLGLYTRASVLLARPLEQVVNPVGAVMDTLLARLQTDPERYRRTYLRTFEALALIIFPFSAICLVLSRPMVLVVLGLKWTGVIPLFSAFALVAISGPLTGLATWLYQSQGRGRDQLWSHSANGLVTLVAYLVGLNWGPLGLILSLALVSATIRLPIVYYIAGRKGPVSTGDLWLSFVSQLPAWGTAYVATMLAYMALANSLPIVQLSVCAPIGFLFGVGLMLPFHRSRENATFAFNTLKSAIVQQWRA
ncbi:MAG: lipopolysaccharide biosynthesis protein [Anaerolineaceae bacterium]|nr:lipopolysaccharide biosynthesis protein [Anaerolineaceae bacterium]